MTRDVPVGGVCDPKFAAVEAAFRRNMADGDPACGEEVGACVSVVVEGETVVDLWGGYADAARTAGLDVTVCADLGAAVSAAAETGADRILICGSLYLGGEVLAENG